VDHDRLFVRFAAGLLAVLLLYGVAMLAVALSGDVVLASKMVSGFGSMFAGILGVGSGYLLGRSSRPPKNGDG
jgi:uncharacterized RDD family membrane protein YckC